MMVNQNKTAVPFHCFVCGNPCLEGRYGALHGDYPNDNGGSDLYFAPLCQGCFLSALMYLSQEHELVIEHKKEPRP